MRSADVIARITAQACRQPGLSLVCQELLDFDGDEIYFQPAPELEGHTFGDALLAYPTSTVIGRCDAGGVVMVNPPMDTRFEAGESVIVISEDDDTVVFGALDGGATVAGTVAPQVAPEPERLLVIGWNPLGAVVLHELDRFTAPGSVADVLVDEEYVDLSDLVDPHLANLAVRFWPAQNDLERLGDYVAEHDHDHVIIMGYRVGLEPGEADARTLLTLLLLHRAIPPGRRRPRIVTELLDQGDVERARVARTTSS